VSRPRLGRAAERRNFLRSEGSGDGWIDYDFAVIRAVPHVHLETHVNVGVVVHARTAGFLRARVAADPAFLAARVPGADPDVLARYLSTHEGVARGDEGCGPIALAPPSERFHWLTAPRSDVIQCSEVHSGRSQDLKATVDALFREYVGAE
jgi:hypothetical protein